ncbi:MAG: hypothetical protein WCV79_02660 [Candidatus Paceibacterota bacterium]|jgi:hypothetical protein
MMTTHSGGEYLLGINYSAVLVATFTEGRYSERKSSEKCLSYFLSQQSSEVNLYGFTQIRKWMTYPTSKKDLAHGPLNVRVIVRQEDGLRGDVGRIAILMPLELAKTIHFPVSDGSCLLLQESHLRTILRREIKACQTKTRTPQKMKVDLSASRGDLSFITSAMAEFQARHREEQQRSFEKKPKRFAR